MPIPIKKRDVIEENWNILFEQIVKGNVIPVIGPEFVELGNVPSTQKIIDAFAESCKIPRGVTSIGKSAFCNCETLKHVELPDSLKLIGKSAFNGCNALESIIIPKGSLTHFKKILDESYHHLLVEK